MSEHEREGSVQRSQDGLLRKKLSRRRMLQATGAAAGALALGGLDGASRAAADPLPAARAARTGTIADLKHIVVLMQENRSYDHFFGTLGLPGSAGFADKQAVAFNNGQSIFFQPDSSYPEGYQLPYHLDTTKYDTQNVGPTMGYYESTDLPWHYALANAYTVGDHYHCSLLTRTEPNRCMLFAGTIDPNGLGGGPLNQNGQPIFKFGFETYPEVLQKAGVSWQVYVNKFGFSTGSGGFLSAGDDYTLQYFAAYNVANASAVNTAPHQGLLARAGLADMTIVDGELTGPVPPAGVENNNTDLEFILQDFINDCAAGLLPEISWIVPPGNWSEHPGDGAINDGAAYVSRVVQALHDNPDLWDSTLLIINYDENNAGGFFDHVLRPVAEPGTPGEAGTDLASGTGSRVPLILVSPWTRGGWIAKETFDHTSLIQFMEAFTTSLGKPALCPNISAWRRSICGDLTSAIDFTSFDNSLPLLPTRDSLLAEVAKEAALGSTPPTPAPGAQTFPVQQTQGPLRLRPAPYQQHASIQVDRSAGTVTATMSNLSAKAASMQVLTESELGAPFDFNMGYSPDPSASNAQTFSIPNTVSKATGPKTYSVDTTSTGGAYNFSIYGPDHFVRTFAGTVIPDGENGGGVPQVDAKLGTGDTPTLKLTLGNGGRTPVQFTLDPNDYSGQRQIVTVRFSQHVSIAWPTNQYGYYDVTVTANTNDGFTQRFAGRIS